MIWFDHLREMREALADFQLLSLQSALSTVFTFGYQSLQVVLDLDQILSEVRLGRVSRGREIARTQKVFPELSPRATLFSRDKARMLMGSHPKATGGYTIWAMYAGFMQVDSDLDRASQFSHHHASTPIRRFGEWRQTDSGIALSSAFFSAIRI